MISVIYEDVAKNYFTCLTEYYIEHLTPSILRRIVVMTIFDIENELDCHHTRAHIFFNSSLADVKKFTGFDSTKMLISCNALVISMAHTDENDRYVVNTWIHRDKDVFGFLYSSKILF